MRKINPLDKINLSVRSGKVIEDVEFMYSASPKLEIESDGAYQIYASSYSPAHMVLQKEGSGDMTYSYEFTNPGSFLKYLLIRLTSGTYLNATISYHTNVASRF